MANALIEAQITLCNVYLKVPLSKLSKISLLFELICRLNVLKLIFNKTT